MNHIEHQHESVSQYGFIVTKPLQLMIVMAIIKQLPGNVKKEILLVDAFENAEQVAQNLSRVVPSWAKVRYVHSFKAAYRLAARQGYKKLFIDSDVGLRKFVDLALVKLLSPATSIAVYEEGLGTYRNDLYGARKKFWFKKLGIGSFFGGAAFTREIYVYHPAEYSSKFSRSKLSVCPIDNSVANVVSGSERFLSDVFGLSGSELDSDEHVDGICVFYLTSWVVDDCVIKSLRDVEGARYLKFHPHIKNKSGVDSSGFCLIPSHVPAEIFIFEAAKSFRLVRVFHHGSSVVRYISLDNVVFIDVASNEIGNVRRVGQHEIKFG